MKFVISLAIVLSLFAGIKSTGWKRRCYLKSPSYGKVVVGYGFKKYANHGETAKYSCDHGYLLRGSSSRKCENGRLTGTTCSCVKPIAIMKKCKVPMTTSGLLITPANGYVASGTTIRFRCRSGYKLLGSSIRKCSNGNLSGSTAKCINVHKSCRVMSAPSNGEVSPSVRKYVSHGSSAKYSCRHGYKLTGYALRECNNGIFQHNEPTCTKVTCYVDEDNLPINGYAKDIEEGDSVNVGGILEYKCDSEYDLDGDDEVTCLSTGEFSDEPPMCIRVERCRVPSAPKYGSVLKPSGSNMYVGDDVDFRCGHGYALNGESSLVCVGDNTFSTLVPTCEKIYRPCKRPSFKYSRTTFTVSPSKSSYSHNEWVEIGCAKGSVQHGKRRQCRDGKWSITSTPKCYYPY